MTQKIGADFYVEAAKRAGIALAKLEAWEGGAKAVPYGDVTDLVRYLTDGREVHKEVMDALPLPDRNPFYACVMSMNGPNSYTQRRGHNPKISNALSKIRSTMEKMAAEAAAPVTDVAVQSPHGLYVHPRRIAELQGLSGAPLDVRRLIRLLEELNLVYQAGCYMAAIMIIRTILDHVPTVFGFTTFREVVANYGGGQSFKKLMKQLESESRNVADGQLHSVMRSHESELNDHSVEFKAALDALVAEVVRVLKQQSQPSS